MTRRTLIVLVVVQVLSIGAMAWANYMGAKASRIWVSNYVECKRISDGWQGLAVKRGRMLEEYRVLATMDQTTQGAQP